ncbi:MAG: 5-oxoprolinase subunit PxpB [Saprospiraceae bacterium]|nr:5-oxoprolinase subunit PxpB [Saprospiraceae bacterium]
MVEIKRFGDRGVLVNFEQKIEAEINQQVIGLSEALLDQYPGSVLYTIPAYCSLTIQYNPSLISFPVLSKSIEELLEKGAGPTQADLRQIEIPVCYDSKFGLDLEAISASIGLSSEALIAAHSQALYRVYMLGFLPGFVYMGKLPERLHCKRRSDPRLRVPQQSVAIAGAQTGIYPSEAPGGWNIIGRTPLPLILPEKAEPFLFRAGDRVRFKPVSLSQFQQIEEQVQENKYELKVTYV